MTQIQKRWADQTSTIHDRRMCRAAVFGTKGECVADSANYDSNNEEMRGYFQNGLVEALPWHIAQSRYGEPYQNEWDEFCEQIKKYETRNI